MRYTSFASQQEKFRARTLRATTAAPPHAVLRESLLCVNSAAEMGVCSDVNAISPSRTVVFSSAADAFCCMLREVLSGFFFLQRTGVNVPWKSPGLSKCDFEPDDMFKCVSFILPASHSVKFLSFPPTEFLFSPHPSPASSLPHLFLLLYF